MMRRSQGFTLRDSVANVQCISGHMHLLEPMCSEYLAICTSDRSDIYEYVNGRAVSRLCQILTTLDILCVSYIPCDAMYVIQRDQLLVFS